MGPSVFCLFGERWGDGGEPAGGPSVGGASLDAFWSLEQSVTGPRTLFVTVANWDTTLSTLLSVGGAGGPEEELDADEDVAL